MKPLPEARREVLAAVPALPPVSVQLLEASGLVLAEPVLAPHDVPPFKNSAMDGYAVRADDVREAPVVLAVVEDLPAGYVATSSVGPGAAIRIMTGAPIPEGADAVVRVEDTEPRHGKVWVGSSVLAGTNIRAAGGDVVAGTRVFEAGERLGAAHLGVLASLGVANPIVRRRPRVAILSTGDEVMSPDVVVLQPGQIRDTNRMVLNSLLLDLGAEVLDLGIVRDDADLLAATLNRAAIEADAILTSGGVSMGEYDLVKAVLRDLGRISFWQVAMQPGKPFAFGLLNGTPFFGLPGNPVSVMVAYEQFARPALLHMMGATNLFRPRIRGRMLQPVDTNPDKVVFLRVRAGVDDTGEWAAELSGGQLSNMLSAMAYGNAFAVIPVGTGAVEAGDEVDLEMFTWPETRTKGEVLDG
ncbi:MAG: molybdopterin molybdotransferase MoeA [Acidimicrobiia bacterium]|nr:molybdopterin molybdotransferase MoeA [Acidimicrobiia bacterium]MDH3396539.1 molybdopterin molybdotransferase MoeA [Acidimicrobiia bacterium]